MVLQILAVTFGVAVAQADLPNANLPGNSPSLPNSNLPGPVPIPEDRPIMLPNTDTSRQWEYEREAAIEQYQQAQSAAQMQQQTLQLSVKALEESQKARADAAAAQEAADQAQEAADQAQQQPSTAPLPSQQP